MKLFTTNLTGSLNISSSLTVGTNINAISVTASLFGTSSWAESLAGSVVSASYAETASILLGSVESANSAVSSSWASSSISASYADTASLLLGSVESANSAVSASWASSSISASYASSIGYSINQDLSTTSTPTFGGITSNGNVSITAGGLSVVGSFTSSNAALFGSSVTINGLFKHLSGRFVRFNSGNSTPVTFTTSDEVWLGNPTAADQVVNLPAANSQGSIGGQIFTIIRGSTATKNIIVTRAGSDTINGNTTITLYEANDFVTVVSDGGTRWEIVGAKSNDYVYPSASYAYTSSILLGFDQTDYVQNSSTSSFVLNSQTSSMTVLSASYAETASILLGSVESANSAVSASWASSSISSSYATTASYALNGGTGGSSFWFSSAQDLIYTTGSAEVQGNLTASIISASSGITGSLLGTASYADSATNITQYTINQNLSTTSQVTFAGITSSLYGTASWAESLAGSVVSASYAETASLLLGSVESANSAISASWASSSISASYADTASLLLGSVESANSAVSASWASSSISASYLLYSDLDQGPIIQSGIIAAGDFTGNPRTYALTLGIAYSTVDAYSAVVMGEDARSWTIESKTASGFTINTNSNQSLAGNTFWQTISTGSF